MCELYEQYQKLREGEEMGPGSFGLEEAFDLNTCSPEFSAMNIASADPAQPYSVFWHKANISRWSGRRGKFTASVSQKTIGTDG